MGFQDHWQSRRPRERSRSIRRRITANPGEAGRRPPERARLRNLSGLNNPEGLNCQVVEIGLAGRWAKSVIDPGRNIRQPRAAGGKKRNLTDQGAIDIGSARRKPYANKASGMF